MKPNIRKDIAAIADPFAFARRLRTAIWVYDTDNCRIAFANEAACKIWDAADEAALKSRDLSADMTKDVSNRLKKYQSDFVAKDVKFNETWTLHPNGTPVTLNLLYSGFEMPDGRMAMMSEVICEKDLTTDTLRSTKALLHTDVIIAMFTSEGQPLYKNPAAWNLMPDANIPLAALFSERHEYEKSREDWQKDGDSQRITRLKTASGERWFDVRVKPCLDAVDGLPTLLLTAIDVNELNVMKMQSELYQEQLQATFSTSLDGIFMVDAEGRILDCNKASQRIFGFDLNDIFLKLFSDVTIPERFRETVYGRFLELQKKTPEDILKKRHEIKALRANGQEFISEISISKSRGSKGDIIFIIYVRDISKAKAAEKAVLAAKDAAEAGSRAKSEFLANMSHEVRTPMNGVLGMLDVLRLTPLTEDQKKYTDIIQKSGDNLLAIIDDMLSFSDLETGKLPLNLARTNLEKTIQNVIDLAVPEAKEKQLSLSLNFSPELPTHFITGQNHIHAIITNLISNAIKFTHQGSIDVSVRGTLLQDNADVIIRVKDTGIGIPKDKQALIFEKFTQVESSITRQYGGTGLGLSISRHLALALGGKLEVISEAGQGSLFTLRLPLKVVEGSKPKKQPQKLMQLIDDEGPQSGSAPIAKKPHLDILVAEDCEASRDALTDLIRHSRIKLTFVKTGLAAVQASEAKKYSLIFMSAALPVMDGVKAAQKIRIYEKQRGRRHTPIIALTSRPAAQEPAKFFRAGIDDVVAKPLKKASLIRALSQGLKKRQHQEPVRAKAS